MFINNRQKVTNYSDNTREVNINGAWIEIYQDGKIIYGRYADNRGANKWFDESHRRIVNALHELESAILEAPIETQD